ncbi:MAG: cell division protein FtsA [Hyphomicrobiales bacterium]|nr:cell division protein FtsA [Hyphomicrobiales bacterium]
MSGPAHLPRLRPLHSRKNPILAALDVGTSKIVCLIVRLERVDAKNRTGCRILGIGHQRSRGVKAGQIVDMEEAETAIRLAVDAAERMAGVQIEQVVVSASGGRIGSQHFTAKVAVGDRTVSESDIHRVLEASCLRTGAPGRAVLHSLPTRFSLDNADGIADPRGMIGAELGADLHVASCDIPAIRNLALAVERCHLGVEAFVASPYASALSTLAEDEAEIGATLMDFGGGSTSIAVFAQGALIHLDSFGVGGQHVTLDIARGLNVKLSNAERLKTLYGSAIASSSDERETVAIEPVGEERGQSAHVPRSHLVRIIRPRVEEIMELARDRLRAAGYPAHAGTRLVLTGGASQLTGLPETARRILSGQARLGRPMSVPGLPESGKSPAFSAAVGLLAYPQVADKEHFEPSRARPVSKHGEGYIGRVGRWLKESF